MSPNFKFRVGEGGGGRNVQGWGGGTTKNSKEGNLLICWGRRRWMSLWGIVCRVTVTKEGTRRRRRTVTNVVYWRWMNIYCGGCYYWLWYIVALNRVYWLDERGGTWAQTSSFRRELRIFIQYPDMYDIVSVSKRPNSYIPRHSIAMV